MHFLKWKFRKKIQINILAILVKFLKKEKYPLFFRHAGDFFVI